MSIDIDYVVVGAGVIGLAIARELALSGAEVLVAESASTIGQGISSRNSEVIHGGLYYPPNSLKAKFCIQGKAMLYAYCQAHSIAHKRLGKLLVATHDAQISKLDDIANNAKACGVYDLQNLTMSQVTQMEPELNCVAALFSPSTGIIDCHGLMLTLQGEAENHGAQFVFHTPLKQVSIESPNQFLCEFADSANTNLRCKHLINAAGLHAVQLAHAIQGLSPQYIPQEHKYCKGRYFSLRSKVPFSHLIYPVPNQDGLGVHLTLDLGNQAKFGPDVVWVESENYEVKPADADAFYPVVREYWPALPNNALQPGYAGIRPKISYGQSSATDFLIMGPQQHHIDGLINLFGIESPGLTSSLAIGQYVKNLLL